MDRGRSINCGDYRALISACDMCLLQRMLRIECTLFKVS